MPLESRTFRQVDLRFCTLLVEETKHDLVCDLTVNREIGADPVEVRAKGIRLARPNLHAWNLPAEGHLGLGLFAFRKEMPSISWRIPAIGSH
jgi:hypothetical protein